MDVPIKVITNFITESESVALIDYINLLEKTMLKEFANYQEGKRLALQFGKDLYHGHSSRLDMSLLGNKKHEFHQYFNRITQATKDLFQIKLESELYVCSFWLSKQYPGANIEEHEDTDDGHNTHFKYSGVLYLNKMHEGGELYFSKYRSFHSPEGQDLVLFPSQGTGAHGVAEITQDRYSLVFWMTDIESMRIP